MGGAFGLVYVASFVLPFVYFTVSARKGARSDAGEARTRDQVADDHGGSVGYGRSFGRYAITFLFAIFISRCFLDYLWPLGSKTQALHDKVAGSFVVRT